MFPDLGSKKRPPEKNCEAKARMIEQMLHFGGFATDSAFRKEDLDDTKQEHKAQLSHSDGRDTPDPKRKGKWLKEKDNEELQRCIWRNFSFEFALSDEGFTLMVHMNGDWQPLHFKRGQLAIWEMLFLHGGHIYPVRQVHPRIIGEISNKHHDFHKHGGMLLNLVQRFELHTNQS